MCKISCCFGSFLKFFIIFVGNVGVKIHAKKTTSLCCELLLHSLGYTTALEYPKSDFMHFD